MPFSSSTPNSFTYRCRITKTRAMSGLLVLRARAQCAVGIVRTPRPKSFGPVDHVDRVLVDPESVRSLLEVRFVAKRSDGTPGVVPGRIHTDERVPVALGLALDLMPDHIDRRPGLQVIMLRHRLHPRMEST